MGPPRQPNETKNNELPTCDLEGSERDSGLQQVATPWVPTFPNPPPPADCPQASPAIHSGRRQSTGHTISDRVGSIMGEDGRTYQAYMPEEYILPNDGDEQERLDMQHALYLKNMHGRLFAAPLRSPRHVLDLGAGTGIWVLQFAKLYPDAVVIGTDLSSIQPVPRSPNVQFWIENSETQDWVFPRPFDYIHIRGMGPCFNDFMTVIQKCYSHTVSGGWIELQDGSWELQSPDGTLRDTALERWYQLLIIGAARLGRDMIKAKFYKEYLETAGYVDVVEQILPMPGGGWLQDKHQKEVGLLTAHSIYFAIDSFRRFILSAGLSQAEADRLIVAAKEDLRSSDIHFYVTGSVAALG